MAREILPKLKEGILKELDTDPLPVREGFVAHELGVVKRLHDAGVPFLAGTDTPAGVGVLPGTSLHHELERFVAAGFTPLEALQTATRNPAIFFLKLADFGTVAEGKVADLVLLDANPLDDIRNTRKIAAVVANGRQYARERSRPDSRRGGAVRAGALTGGASTPVIPRSPRRGIPSYLAEDAARSGPAEFGLPRHRSG